MKHFQRVYSEDSTMLPTEESIKMDAYPLHTEISFFCNDGYERVGPSYVYCEVDGSWTDEPPRCSRESCEKLVQPDHGSVTYTHLKEGGVATFQCDACYRLQGYQELRCDEGEWLPQIPPTCSPNVCYPPGEEQNSYIIGYNSSKVSSYFSFDSIVAFINQKDFEFSYSHIVFG